MCKLALLLSHLLILQCQLPKAYRVQYEPDEALPLAEASSLLHKLTASSPADGSSQLLDDLIAFLWPHVDKAVWNLVSNRVNPLLTEKLPYVLSGFQIEPFTLGKEPLKVIPSQFVHQKDGRAKFVAQVDLKSVPDIIISNSSERISIGVQNLRIRGTITIVLHLIDKLPIISGVQVYFIDSPSIECNFAGTVGRLANLPVLESVVRLIINQVVRGILVLPNSVGFNLGKPDKAVDAAAIAKVKPIGVLKITPLKLEGLANEANQGWSILGILRQRLSRPYVHIQIGEQEWSSNHIVDMNNPVWRGESSPRLPVFDREQKLIVSIFQKGLIKDSMLGDLIAESKLGGLIADTKLGVASVMTIDQVLKSAAKKWMQLTLPLHDSENSTEPNGNLLLSLEWLLPVPFQQKITPGMMEVAISQLIVPKGLAIKTAALRITFAELTQSSRLGWESTSPHPELEAMRPVIQRSIKAKIPKAQIAEITGLSEELVDLMSGVKPASDLVLNVNSILFFTFEQSQSSFDATFEWVDAKDNVLGNVNMDIGRMLNRPDDPFYGHAEDKEHGLSALIKVSCYGLDDGWTMGEREAWVDDMISSVG